MSEQASGNLVKLKIKFFSDPKYSSEVGQEFEAMFNPNKYSTKYEIEHDDNQAQGTSANSNAFGKMKPQELALEFFLDGTGVTSGTASDVQEKVDEFLQKAYEYKGDKHRSRYLRIWWSALVFDCVLTSAEISYTLFNSSGKPLRAKINARFKGFINDELRVRGEDAASPDLTHQRMVEGGQRIDYLTNQIYDSPDYYIDIARKNQLVGFRELRAGSTLFFPPVVKGSD